MPRRRKGKSSPRVNITGDPDAYYESTENITGPGREAAIVGFGHIDYPNKLCFTLRYPHDAPVGEGRMMTTSWNAPYAAKLFLEYVIGKDKITWPNLRTIITSKGVSISCSAPSDRTQENDLEIALNHRCTNAESAFKLPEQQRKSIDLMLRPWPDETQKVGRAKVQRGLAARRPDGDFITVAQIAQELGLEPREGRAALRKAKYEKPNFGWSFMANSPELEEVRKILKKALR